MANQTRTGWRLIGDEVAACNCDWGCPCQFNALPTHGRCDGVAGYQVSEGHYGSVRLDGVRFAQLYWFPGAVHEGNGTTQLILDEGMRTDQRNAIIAITSGNDGGNPFEIFSAVCPNKLEPIVAPVLFECDRDGRYAAVTVSGIAEVRAEPIKNPVTGEDHRVRIVLPDGFEFKEAEIANAAVVRSQSSPPLVFEYSGTYAQLNAFDWSNT